MTDDETRATAERVKQDNDKTAGMAGAGAGVLAGAQVGTVLLPIPVMGTFTGALVGGIVGTKIGKKVGSVIFDTISVGKDIRGTQSAESAKRFDVAGELERLSKLRDAGDISEDEFSAAKAKLLGL